VRGRWREGGDGEGARGRWRTGRWRRGGGDVRSSVYGAPTDLPKRGPSLAHTPCALHLPTPCSPSSKTMRLLHSEGCWHRCVWPPRRMSPPLRAGCACQEWAPTSTRRRAACARCEAPDASRRTRMTPPWSHAEASLTAGFAPREANIREVLADPGGARLQDARGLDAPMRAHSARTDRERRPARPSVPALALSVERACEALGVSWDTWREHVEPDVKLVRVGRRKLIPTSELQAWLERHAERVMDR
jgi:excisionase family DNA binding protein